MPTKQQLKMLQAFQNKRDHVMEPVAHLKDRLVSKKSLQNVLAGMGTYS